MRHPHAARFDLDGTASIVGARRRVWKTSSLCGGDILRCEGYLDQWSTVSELPRQPRVRHMRHWLAPSDCGALFLKSTSICSSLIVTAALMRRSRLPWPSLSTHVSPT